VAAYQKPEAERSPAEVKLIYELLRHDGRIRPEEWPRLLEADALARRQTLLARLATVEGARPRPLPTARGIIETGGAMPPTFFLKRGEFSARGPAVEPEFPSVLSATAPLMTPTTTSSGRRRALADWLTRADHPLTPRVIVNRIFQGHFGRGLVATPSDFGKMGDEPTHAELLDWLACELVDRGWSLKTLHREIVTSATYRQTSTQRAERNQDRENRLLGKQNRRRLDGEAIRDALLLASGQMNAAMGGPGVFPPLPAELTKLSSKGAIWPLSTRIQDQNRRSLYVFVRRNLRYPFFEAFDRPDTNVSCPRRPVTTIAPQALSLLNSPLAVQAARAMSLRVRRERPASRDQQIERAHLLALGRRPEPTEVTLARSYLEAGGSLDDYCLALLNLNEFIYID
jgi:hypothetical protein